MDVQFRTATKKDKEILERFQAKLVQFERAIVPTIPKDTVYYDIDELLTHKETLVLIITADGKDIGCGFAQVRVKEECASERSGYIGMMYLEEEFRKRGIGTTLVKKFLEWLHEKKVQDIRLRVYDKNLDAVHAYRNCGFESFMVEMIYKN